MSVPFVVQNYVVVLPELSNIGGLPSFEQTAIGVLRI